jgi:hypothetical protein
VYSKEITVRVYGPGPESDVYEAATLVHKEFLVMVEEEEKTRRKKVQGPFRNR